MIHESQSLVSATVHGHSLRTYDDGFGPLWVVVNSLGPIGVIRARTWESAYGIAEDEIFPEADETLEEIVKEYGFRRETHKIIRDKGTGEERRATSADYPCVGQWEFVRWETKETPDAGAWSENELFQEAFGFRPNGPNSHDIQRHGIYAKDLNGERLDRLTPELAEELGIETVLRTED